MQDDNESFEQDKVLNGTRLRTFHPFWWWD